MLDVFDRHEWATPKAIAIRLGSTHQMKNVVKSAREHDAFESFPYPVGSRQVYYRFTRTFAEEHGYGRSYVGALKLSRLRRHAGVLDFCFQASRSFKLLRMGEFEEFDDSLQGLVFSTKCAVVDQDKHGHTFPPRLSPLVFDTTGDFPSQVIRTVLAKFVGGDGWREKHTPIRALIDERRFHPHIISPSESRGRDLEEAIHRKNTKKGGRPLPFPISVFVSNELRALLIGSIK